MPTDLFRALPSMALCALLGAFSIDGACAAPSPADTFAAWALRSGDTHGKPFAVLDKHRATLVVFDAVGARRASSPVLLGSAVGDDSVLGIGERPIRDILPFERTTPAGRFVTEPGVNTQGEDIVWVDYDAAISMHRVRALPGERRLERLASATPRDNRISYGCINVPAGFYDRWIRPVFGAAAGVVYVLPETRGMGTLIDLKSHPGRPPVP